MPKFLVTTNWTRIRIYRLKDGKRRGHKLSASERAAKNRNYAKRESAIDALARYVAG